LNKYKIAVIATSFLLVGGCQLKDVEQSAAAREVQWSCDNTAIKKYPILNVTKRFSEPVYVEVPTGQITCQTKYVRQPNVVPGVGVLSHTPKTTCVQQTSRQRSHTRTWEEVVDTNLKKRNEYALACKKDWCEANFDNSYWTAGFNDAELCVRTK
jgi:hypothetical protein